VNWLLTLYRLLQQAYWNWKARGHWAARGYFFIEGKLYNGEGDGDMAYVLGDDKKVLCAVAWVDKKGKAAKVDGAPTWGSSDDAICGIVDVAADGMSAMLVGGELGGAQIAVTADADLGAGITPVIALLDVVVEPGTAIAGVLTPGEQIDQ